MKPILLILNNPFQSRMLSYALPQIGVNHPVQTALDGKAAIDLLFSPEATCNPCLIVIAPDLSEVAPQQLVTRLLADHRSRNIPRAHLCTAYDGERSHMPPGETYLGRFPSDLEQLFPYAEQIRSILDRS